MAYNDFINWEVKTPNNINITGGTFHVDHNAYFEFLNKFKQMKKFENKSVNVAPNRS